MCFPCCAVGVFSSASRWRTTHARLQARLLVIVQRTKKGCVNMDELRLCSALLSVFHPIVCHKHGQNDAFEYEEARILKNKSTLPFPLQNNEVVQCFIECVSPHPLP